MATIPIPSQADLLNDYFQYLKAENPDINPAIDPTLNILGNVYSGMFAGLYSTVYLYGLNIFPQTASGSYLDIQLAKWGLPPRSGGAYALGSVGLTVLQSNPTTIVAGSIMTDSTGTLIYKTQESITIPGGPDSLTTYVPIISENAISGYAQPIGTLLNLQTSINGISQLKVISLNDGGDPETDVQVQTRLLNSIQNYLLGGTKSDYQNWCLQASSYVTGSSVILISTNNINIYLLGGQLNINNVLSNPLILYNRGVNSAVINIVAHYIEGKRPFTDIPTIYSCSTYTISTVINIAVQLIPGYGLDTLISNTNLPVSPITVKNLILQEFRRAIILSAQNAQYLVSENAWYITKETLLGQLSSSLSASSIIPGIYAQILLNTQLTIGSPTPDVHGIVVPNPDTGQIIYDLENTPNPYNNITVSILS